MDILIKSALIIDSNSSFNGAKMDVLIENGIIIAIKNKIQAEKNTKVIEAANLHISAGWFDIQSDFCDPGYEYKEDLMSGIALAAAGGYTGVAIVPSTHPPIHSKAEVLYVKNKTKEAIVDVYPIGALSHNQEGKDISEMYDMHLAGAIAFSDDKKVVSNAGLLIRALLYASNFNGVIITHCDEKSVSQDGKMNEGVSSTLLGLKGIPALAEEMMVNRNIFIAEYTNCPIHISSISTKKSVDLIRNAKAKKLKVTASVNAYNLVLSDEVLYDFDTNYKLDPPLRTKEDIEALRKGIIDGTIDCISSDHRPQDNESKNLEFDHAINGMIGLETVVALVSTFCEKIKLENLISCITSKPRQLFHLKEIKIEVGEVANITLFNPFLEWEYKKENSLSKSCNTPFLGSKMKGKALGIINNKQVYFNN